MPSRPAQSLEPRGPESGRGRRRAPRVGREVTGHRAVVGAPAHGRQPGRRPCADARSASAAFRGAGRDSPRGPYLRKPVDCHHWKEGALRDAGAHRRGEHGAGECRRGRRRVPPSRGKRRRPPGIEGMPALQALMRVEPVWTSRTMGINQPEMVELDKINKVTDAPYMSHADCHLTAQTIMGSTENLSNIGGGEKAIVEGLEADAETAVEPIEKKVADQKGWASHGGEPRAGRVPRPGRPEVRRPLEGAGGGPGQPGRRRRQDVRALQGNRHLRERGHDRDGGPPPTTPGLPENRRQQGAQARLRPDVRGERVRRAADRRRARAVQRRGGEEG